MNDRKKNGEYEDRDEWQRRADAQGANRQDGSSRGLAFQRDYDRDRHAYDRPGGWRGPSPAYSPDANDRGMGTRDYGYGQRDAVGRDDRDAWQRDRAAMSDWERGYHHGRAVGEQGYGAEYRGRDGHGATTSEKPRGKAPKGYVRSDERIREDICERLAAQEHDWSDVEVHVSDGEATLTGTVRSRDMKYEAERVTAGVRDVSDVTNQIRVKSPYTSEPADPRSEPSNGHDKRSRSTIVSR